MKLKKIFQTFLNDETGQSTTEYILILAVVVMIALKFKTAIGDKIGQAAGTIGEKINTQINELTEQ